MAEALQTLAQARAAVAATVMALPTVEAGLEEALGRVLADDVVRRGRRSGLRQQRDGRLRRARRARPAAGCGSSASRARARRTGAGWGPAKRSASPRARRCPRAPTRWSRSSALARRATRWCSTPTRHPGATCARRARTCVPGTSCSRRARGSAPRSSASRPPPARGGWRVRAAPTGGGRRHRRRAGASRASRSAAGQIHDSNALALAALARAAGAEVVSSAGVSATTASAPGSCSPRRSKRRDVLVSTGGVSVGAHDHVKPALGALASRSRSGASRSSPASRPGSAPAARQLVVRPARQPGVGAGHVPAVRRARAASASGRPVSPAGGQRAPGGAGCTHARARARRPRRALASRRRRHATPTGAQGSHLLTSMLGADGLAIVPPGEGELPVGTVVELLGVRSSAPPPT